MRLVVVFFCLCIFSPTLGMAEERTVGSEIETEPRIVNQVSKPGYYGWGVGLQVPMVGVMTGVGSVSSPGSGYNLGFALTWEFLPRYEVRLYGSGGQTYGAKASVDYRADGETQAESQSEEQNAQWLGLDLGLGVAYLFRAPKRSWTPFLGLDGGFSFHGYYYSLTPEMSLKLVQFGDAASRFAYGETEGIGVSWHASGRGGVRLDFLDWLSSSLELIVTVSPISDDEPITNTKSQREVTAPGDMLVLTRLVFSIWLGL